LVYGPRPHYTFIISIHYIHMPDCYSVTIRPRIDSYRKHSSRWIDLLKTYFAKKLISYVIGKECGKDNVENHLQIAILVTMRSDSIRRSITRLLDYTPEDDMESKVWLKVRKHNDPNYLIGYCTKECSYTTNMKTSALKTAQDHYCARLSKIEKSKQLPKWLCTGVNSLLPVVYQYTITSGFKGKYPFKVMADFLAAKGLIPFSLSRKIKITDNKVFEAYVRLQESDDSDEDILDQLFDALESELLSK